MQKSDITPDALIEKLSSGMGVEILTDGGDQAYYSPMQDKIHLPTPGSFRSAYAFNATALHELSHSTGHPARLNRPQGGAVRHTAVCLRGAGGGDMFLLHGCQSGCDRYTAAHR